MVITGKFAYDTKIDGVVVKESGYPRLQQMNWGSGPRNGQHNLTRVS